jgi:hypothetical protein
LKGTALRHAAVGAGILILAATGATALLVWHRDPVAENGPLSIGDESAFASCVLEPTDQRHVAWAPLMVYNETDTPVTLDSVELTDPVDITLVDGHLIPWINNGIANGQWLPPSADDESVRPADLDNWAARKVIGSPEAVVQKKGDGWQLALEIDLPKENLGYSHGFAIYYHSDSGKRYVARSDTWVGVGSEKQPCADWEAPEE